MEERDSRQKIREQFRELPDAADVRRAYVQAMKTEEETMTTLTPVTTWVELAKREADDLEVLLLWDRSCNRVKVAVNDGRVCHHLDFEVARTDALDAFHHPFVYATSQLGPGLQHETIASGQLPKGEES
jgi:hypothetical protein